MTKREKPEPRYLWIQSKQSSNYGLGGTFHVTAQMMTRRGDNDQPFGSGDESVAALHITSQGNCEDEQRHLYGWDVRFMHLYSVDLADVERMTKTLKTVQRFQAKQYEQFGNADTFAAYVVRVGAALGVDGYVHESAPHGGWRWMNAAEAHSHITHLEHVWKQAGIDARKVA